MKEIGILVPTIGEKTLAAVMESIRRQSYENYEIIVVDSSKDYKAKDLLNSYDCKVIKTGPDIGLLAARYIACQNCDTRFALNLDATKTLHIDALAELASMMEKRDMIVVIEDRQGKGRWTRLAQIDKAIVGHSENLSKDEELPLYLVPRFYRRSILYDSLNMLVKTLPEDIFTRILWPEDRLIFSEARVITKSLGFTNKPLISHIGDDTFSSVAKKYYRYGKSYKLLKRSGKYSKMIKLKSRQRNLSCLSITEKLNLFGLYSVRVSSFLLGYYM